MSKVGSNPPFSHPAAETVRACPYDLVLRAQLAIDGCTNLTNPQRGGQPYTFSEFHTDPPVAMHSPWDYASVAGALLDAISLARIMTGQPPDAFDAAFANLLASCQREDGFIALPPDPWTHAAPVVEIEWSQRGALMAWTTLAQALDDAEAHDRAERLVQALYRNAVWEGDTCWYPSSYLPNGGWLDRTPPTGKMSDVLIGAQVIYPLTRFSAATGSKVALDTASGLIKYFLERSGAFQHDGTYTSKTGKLLVSNAGFVLGVLNHGIITDNENHIEWAYKAYMYLREQGTEFGFFPHELDSLQTHPGCTSVLQKMIEIALLLGKHRDKDCYADADRYGRNHLLETQLVSLNWITQPTDVEFTQELWCGDHPEEGITVEDVAQRVLGGFASWHLPNDAFDPMNPRLSLRSTASGTRALYALWHHSMNKTENAVQVNLHFSHESRWARMTSYLPAEGKIEVMMKSRGVLAVRMPDGVDDPQVFVNKTRPRNEIMRDGYAWLEALQQGDMVEITWTLSEDVRFYELKGENLTAHWRGDTLLRLTPHGPLQPLYHRLSDVVAAQPVGATGQVKQIDSI